MSKFHLDAKPDKQTWQLTVRATGRRYIGCYFPFTDPNLTEELDKACGVYSGLLRIGFREMGIKDGVPQMIDADNSSYKIIATGFMLRINKILQMLVDKQTLPDELSF